jgi:hypothetical protein
MNSSTPYKNDFDNRQNKPKYVTDSIMQYGMIEYNEKKYIMDLSDRDDIINFPKQFIFTKKEDIYPSYQYNQHRFTYLQFIYHYRENNVNYIFENGNPYDLRRCNVTCYHIFHRHVTEHYQVTKYIPGHYSKNGVDPYHMKNPLWSIQENGNEYILMYCEKDTLCKLCPYSYKKILDFEQEHNMGKKITFHKHTNGYIISSNQLLYIHQIITGCYGNGKGTKQVSVDHIDRDPLNNTMGNLRLATREEQEQNSKCIMIDTKRARKQSARELPEGITQDMMRKYVVYYKEWVYPEKVKTREYFKIEKHPKLDKIWIGTKSNNISIFNKLEQANKKIDELDNKID